MAAKRAKTAFATFIGDQPRMIHAGDLIDDADPVLVGREALFEDVETYVARVTAPVEATTAAPGEKRAVTPPAAPAGPKPGPPADQPRRSPGRGRRNQGDGS